MQSVSKIVFGYLIVLTILLQGCAVGNKYNFTDVDADLAVASVKVKNIAVATSDQRKEVISGKCDPTYVGMQRAGLGNPWRVSTASGLPFADDLTKAVTEALAKKGYNSLPVYVKYTDDQTGIFKILKGREAERNLLFVIKKWESDTYTNIGLDYEVELTVYNADFLSLASVSAAEKKDLPGSAWDPPKAARREIPIAFKKVLETLLNDPKVIQAIQ